MNTNYLGIVIFTIFCCPVRAEVSITQGLSYDDVLLTPKHSTVSSRKLVSTQTRLTKNILLSNPLVSANMDTITEATMAIAMAQHGGIGIIHRFNSIERQVEEVEKVKRFRSAKIDCPLTISPDATVADVRELMEEKGASGFLVANEDRILLGILTQRDIRFRPSLETLVSDLMTPREKLIVGSPDIAIHDAKKLLMEHRIEKLPLVHDDGTIAGLITSKDIYIKAEYPYASVDAQGRLLVGAAIGVNDDYLDRAAALIKAGVDVLVIDIAHGDSVLAVDTTRQLKKLFPDVDVIAGNVATAEGTRRLIEAGADAVKVGVGPGSICTTRIVTGCGFPQLSAVINCAQEANKYDIPIIADGGIKQSGDITKAIAAGASTVMLGSILAGTDESPGVPFTKNGKKFKIVRGMASFVTNLNRKDKKGKKTDYVPEGVEAMTPYKGPAAETINQLLGGLRSGMSYCGVTELNDLRGNGDFVQITAAGIRESHAHDVSELA
jgi:IMP dehydrogenase